MLLHVGGLASKLCRTLATLWTVACQAPLSMEFSKQESWSGLPFPSPFLYKKPKTEEMAVASIYYYQGLFNHLFLTRLFYSPTGRINPATPTEEINSIPSFPKK